MIAPKKPFPTPREKIQECNDTCVQLETETEKRIDEAEDPKIKQARQGRLSDLRNLRMTFELLLDEKDEELLGEGVIAAFIRAQRELLHFKADPDRVGQSGKVLESLRKKGEA